MTRADCQALSKHYHVCWLSIPCSQHKIGGQRIIGVRDGKDIWGQLVHPSALSHPLFQIIPYVIFSPSTPVQFSRSSLSPSHHLWGTMVEGSGQLLHGEARYCHCPQLTFMNFVGGLSWNAEGLTEWLSVAFPDRVWRASVCGDASKEGLCWIQP